MDAGGTVPRTELVEPSQEQRPRATYGADAENEAKPNNTQRGVT